MAWAGDDRYKVKRQPVFFFEKKKQKTFDNYDSTLVYELCASLINKVFLLLFVHKKKIFLLLSRGRCLPKAADGDVYRRRFGAPCHER